MEKFTNNPFSVGFTPLAPLPNQTYNNPTASSRQFMTTLEAHAQHTA
ncbi:MAG: hypothetical protein P4L50_20110 [Anaerolineaceae bacterium]|nr:hypothetical protein [Anaerolineaceae bacterium]